ncbi:zinc finger and BTB domain-containing protein 7B-like [Rhinoraja longicauda]
MGASEDELIGIPFPEHSSELLSSLNEQRHRGLLCDVTIVTQGLEYRTHRAVLAACSHYFRKLFTSSKPRGGGGGGRQRSSVCELDFVQPPVLAALLEFAYTATLTISSSNMREVLRAARALEIQCVADACVDILRCSGEGEQEQEPEQPLVAPQPPGEESAPPDCWAGLTPGLEPPKVRRRKRASRRPQPQPQPTPRVTLGNRGCLYRIVQPLRTSSNHKLQLQRPASPARDYQAQGEGEGESEGEAEAPRPLEEEEDAEPLDYRRPQLLPAADGEADGEGDGLELDSLSASFPFPFLSSLGADGIDPASPSPGKPRARGAGAGGAGPGLGLGLGRRKSQMPQECPICHKVIHGAGKLPRHMRTHTGEKPFACEVCAVRFTRNDKLKIHMRKHTGERPYSCTCCDARFLHSYDLKNHARLHTGDRPFECSQCRKAFVRLDHLQRHHKGQNCLEVRTRRCKEEGEEAVNGGQGADGESGPEYGAHSAWSQLASGWDQEMPEEMVADDSS